MAGITVYDRPSYLADIRTLLRRGWTRARIAHHLGLSERTVYRILAEAQET